MSGTIIYVIGQLSVGGAERHFSNIAIDLKRTGWSPEFFVMFPGGEFEQRVIDEGISIHSGIGNRWIKKNLPAIIAGGLCRLSTLLSLPVLLLKKRPKVIHFCLPGSYLVGGWAALVTRTRPRVMSRRITNRYIQEDWIRRSLESFLHKKMDCVIGNSGAVVKGLLEEGVPKEKLKLIYNGVRIGELRRERRKISLLEELNIPADPLILVVVANYHPRKGHADLLAALGLLRETSLVNWICLCIGFDRGNGNALRKLTSKMNLTDNVRWLDGRTDVPELLAAADIGVLPSREEGFSNSLIEKMAAGLPVVVTDVGGNAEAVLNNQTGIIVPPENPSAMAKALTLLIGNPVLRTKMGRAARIRARDKFSQAETLSAYDTLYRALTTRYRR